ncbi:MAG: DUF1491 family protein, partial [Pseudomonadota bacterium]
MGHLADDQAMPRLKADIWVGAYIRRCVAEGAFAALSRRGDESAGAVFIEILHQDGVDLWAPAPMASQRAFERVMEKVQPLEVAERMPTRTFSGRSVPENVSRKVPVFDFWPSTLLS